MFTGIITDVGEVRGISREGDTRFEIRTRYDMSTVDIGASIAHSGVCLTVIETGADWFAVQASAETLGISTLSGWKVGSRMNLERALKVGDELGGHIVSGHVDGVGEVVSVRDDGESRRFVFRVPAALKNFMAPKGSVAVDGVSLTVNEVAGDTFGVNIIPHTQQVTLFGGYAPGVKVNLEIDMLARYVARLLERE
jgi:riboflavin synthase